MRANSAAGFESKSSYADCSDYFSKKEFPLNLRALNFNFDLYFQMLEMVEAMNNFKCNVADL